MATGAPAPWRPTAGPSRRSQRRARSLDLRHGWFSLDLRHGWKSAHLSSGAGKEIFYNYDETKSKEEQKEQERKEGASQAERAIQVVVKARQNQNGSDCGSRFMLGSQRSHCHDKINSGFVDSREGIGQKRRMSSTTERYRVGFLDGHRDWQIRRLRFPRHSHSG